jgi:chromosome segregation protein
LLKLRKVELLGFKSFCEKTHITFSGSGITCIVGPNGCGKSNVVDAISWVLGEQSHKMLRAERMADCIFNGTAKRPATGLAEVTLTLSDPELARAAALVLEGTEDSGALEPFVMPDSASGLMDASNGDGGELGAEAERFGVPEAINEPRRKLRHKPAVSVKPGEVVIGRRIYRSGQSEYLLNGRIARLRDIQQLFMGIGLGPDSYAIIEQGRIGQILSSKPMDRRSIIEEAAGVTIYKSKRRLAETKLEASKANLARLHDILSEVEKQLGSLKRQASKARRYGELRDEFRGKQRRLFGSRAARLIEDGGRLSRVVGEENAAEQTSSQELRSLEGEHESLSTRMYEMDGELKRLQNLVSQCALELDRAENRAAYDREQMANAQSRLECLAGESEQEGDRVLRLVAEQAEREAEIAGLQKQSEELGLQLDDLLITSAIGASSQETLETQLEEMRLSSGRLAEQAVRCQAEVEQAEAANSHAVGQIERQSTLLQELMTAAEEGQAIAQTTAASLERVSTEREQSEASRANAQQRGASLRAQLPAVAQQTECLRQELAGTQARRHSVGQILDERAYSADAVQRLFSAAGGDSEAHGFRAAGLLADYVEVSEQHESAVEQFLHDELEYVVVETFDRAREGVSLLRNEIGGRATFFVDSVRNLSIDGMDGSAAIAPAGVIGRMAELVEFRDPLGPAAKHFLPKLRSAFLVESAAAAEALARENPQQHFVTPEGSCYHGRMVSGGRRGDAGPLALKRELRVLEAEASRLETIVANANAELNQLEETLRAADSESERCLLLRMEMEKNVMAARLRHEQAEAESQRLAKELGARQRESQQLSEEAENSRMRVTDAARRCAEATAERARLEQAAGEAARQLAAIRLGSQSQTEQAGVLRAELAKWSEKLAAAKQAGARLEEEFRAVEQRLHAVHEQRASIERERVSFEGNAAEQAELAETFRAEKVRLEAQNEALNAEWKQIRGRTMEMEEGLRTRRDALEAVRSQRNQHEIERARNDADMEHLGQTCRTELAMEPEVLAIETGASMNPDEMVIAETEYAEMHARLDGMGPINMMALDEFRECEDRNTFLTRERDDLVESIGNTQQAISELDEISRGKFEEAFAAINGHFAEAFRTLFGGGTGEMRLTEPDSSGDSGVDIAAQPPGKRLQNVLLLSGGEKALTALALLIGVFRYRPSPFCILDEVDAPLDEANVGRFNQMFAQMGEHTQFIIITHNRRTMEMGSMLYGVTMQEPGVSRLVSVEWDGERRDAQPTAA